VLKRRSLNSKARPHSARGDPRPRRRRVRRAAASARSRPSGRSDVRCVRAGSSASRRTAGARRGSAATTGRSAPARIPLRKRNFWSAPERIRTCDLRFHGRTPFGLKRQYWRGIRVGALQQALQRFFAEAGRHGSMRVRPAALATRVDLRFDEPRGAALERWRRWPTLSGCLTRNACFGHPRPRAELHRTTPASR
jgi:hypothetical protein